MMIKVKIDVKEFKTGKEERSKHMKITSVYFFGLLIFRQEELFVFGLTV